MYYIILIDIDANHLNAVQYAMDTFSFLYINCQRMVKNELAKIKRKEIVWKEFDFDIYSFGEGFLFLIRPRE